MMLSIVTSQLLFPAFSWEQQRGEKRSLRNQSSVLYFIFLSLYPCHPSSLSFPLILPPTLSHLLSLVYLFPYMLPIFNLSHLWSTISNNTAIQRFSMLPLSFPLGYVAKGVSYFVVFPFPPTKVKDVNVDILKPGNSS